MLAEPLQVAVSPTRRMSNASRRPSNHVSGTAQCGDQLGAIFRRERHCRSLYRTIVDASFCLCYKPAPPSLLPFQLASSFHI
jgi:hypothetical protein